MAGGYREPLDGFAKRTHRIVRVEDHPTYLIGRRSMHQNDYSLHCTKIWDPAVREAPYDLIFVDRGSVQSCVARGKTKSTYFKAITSPWFV